MPIFKACFTQYFKNLQTIRDFWHQAPSLTNTAVFITFIVFITLLAPCPAKRKKIAYPSSLFIPSALLMKYPLSTGSWLSYIPMMCSENWQDSRRLEDWKSFRDTKSTEVSICTYMYLQMYKCIHEFKTLFYTSFIWQVSHLNISV